MQKGTTNTRYALLLAIFTALSFATLATMSGNNGTTSGFATAANSSSNISLRIAGTTVVTVEPAEFNFTDMQIQDTNFTDHPALQLIIRNDGSTNITNVYAHLDTLQSEQNNPLGTGRASEYAAGRFVWMKNETSGFYHAGSLMWNNTERAGGKPAGMNDADNNPKSWGFYRNATGDYLWSLSGNGSTTANSWCNYTTGGNPEVYMKNEADTGNNRDLSSNTVTYSLGTANSDNNWTVTKATSGPLDGHYIAAYKDCTKMYVYRFDASSEFPGNTDPEHYLVSNELVPGQEYNGRLGAAIPEGMPAGLTNRTLLTIYASNGN